MGNATPRHTVVSILTDRPSDYDADMRRLGLSPTYAPSAGGLLEQLQRQAACGLVLEVDKVMRAPALAREQLFQLADVFPVLRVLRRGLDRELVYLDDKDGFRARVEAFHPREVRHAGRVPVLLHGLLASPEEGAGSPVRASILDLSDDGGFVSCPDGFNPGELVRLSIEEMRDPTPLLASIRWCRGGHGKGPVHGFGLRFVRMRPGQVRELTERFLEPQALLETGAA